jgi:hypothetical protein
VRLGPLELGLRHWFLLVAIRPTSVGPGALVGRRDFLTFPSAYSPRALAMISLAMITLRDFGITRLVPLR